MRNLDFENIISPYRDRIDAIDKQIFDLLSERMDISESIGRIKVTNNIPIIQLDRWKSLCERILHTTSTSGLSKNFVLSILDIIHIESIKRQKQLYSNNDD